ncbi:hypothetical protein W822_20065 [Advenella kashmirensis W13003]|uniref:RNA polymerase sigma factor 70 region 4 type 2 domain-containing protein n=1 Tax=Advenella kashmirensis W13003 TaxID=1424334 RepID=V8QLU9_9BURK|nr:hypothetical protein [Advenella kashmirensis]ETF00941.1 hypothetical protein W822_20065 [Advenella kashmirensis W13003]
MQRINYIDGRLIEWAEWRVGGSGYRGIDFESEGNETPRAFVDYTADQDQACMEMDLAIASLPPELKKTVVAVYTWEGGLMMVTHRLRVTRATIHRRLCQADLRLDDYLAGRRFVVREIGKEIVVLD